MKRGLILAAILLVTLTCPRSFPAQQNSESLGDLARKERERKKVQAKPAKVFTSEEVNKRSPTQGAQPAGQELRKEKEDQSAAAKSSASANAPPAAEKEKGLQGGTDTKKPKHSTSELHAFAILFLIAVAEEECREAMGYYVALDALLTNGCSGVGGSFTFHPRAEYDPHHDPDYYYGVNVRGNYFEVYASPYRLDIASFFFDGEDFYESPKGTASDRDKLMDSYEVLDHLRKHLEKERE